MKISKCLASYLMISYMSIAITSCNSSSSGVYRGSLYSETSTTTSPSPEPVKAPEVYDVICFQAMGFGVGRTMCSPDETYKVPRGTQVTVYLDQKTSVQTGTNTVVAFKYKDKSNSPLQKITVPEMESLASEGANVYAMYYHVVPVLLSNSQHFVEVELFNNNLGTFKMFDQDKTQVVFETGDTKARVELPQRKEGLMGDMQAVQNGGIYRKIVTTTQPADGTASGNKVDPTKPADGTASNKPTPATAIIDHYRSIDNKELEKSWSNLSPSFKGSNLAKGFKEYTEWWNSVDKVYIGNVETVKSSDTNSVVKADLSYKLQSGRIMDDKKKYISLVWKDNKWLIDKKSEVNNH